MCDSGLVVVAVLTLMFSFIAIQSIFYSFDFNCNNFYYDDVVGGEANSLTGFRTLRAWIQLPLDLVNNRKGPISQ